jgi:hypothetical protein
MGNTLLVLVAEGCWVQPDQTAYKGRPASMIALFSAIQFL